MAWINAWRNCWVRTSRSPGLSASNPRHRLPRNFFWRSGGGFSSSEGWYGCPIFRWPQACSGQYQRHGAKLMSCCGAKKAKPLPMGGYGQRGDTPPRARQGAGWHVAMLSGQTGHVGGTRLVGSASPVPGCAKQDEYPEQDRTQEGLLLGECGLPHGISRLRRTGRISLNVFFRIAFFALSRKMDLPASDA